MAFPAARRWPVLLRRPPLTCDQAEALLHRLFDHGASPSFGVRLWDGREVALGTGPRVTFLFHDPDTFGRCIGSEDPAEFAEAYSEGRLEVEGDLRDAVAVAFALRDFDPGLAGKLAIVSRLGVPTSRHTVVDDERDVRAHYDLSNDFFSLFLDPRMVYSCAYFRSPGESLEEAQVNKLDLVCRKLDLQPADDFLDIGCGWGALVIQAASRYGARAQGLTLSVNQAAEARRRISAAGVTGRAEIFGAHYDTLPAEAFDKIASVGMYEHVGLRRLPDYCRAAYRALRPGGLFLNHGITLPAAPQARTGGAFIFRHIFPGAELVSVPVLQSTLEAAGFEILDVQSLRPHYALTLRAWHDRFSRVRPQAVALTSERVVRMWEVYLVGCAKAFDLGLVSVHQVLASKPARDGRARIPLTRRAWEPDDSFTTPRIRTQDRLH